MLLMNRQIVAWGSRAIPLGVHQRAWWCAVTCKAVSGPVSRGCPTHFQLETGLGTSLTMGESLFSNLQVILDNTYSIGSCIVVLKNECIPMPTGVGHNSRLSDVVSVTELSDIPLTDVEVSSPNHDDAAQNRDNSVSIAVLCNHGWRLVTLPSSTQKNKQKTFSAHHECREQLSTRLRAQR